MGKIFHLREDQIKPLAVGKGGGFATDAIMVEGYPVGFMYREVPEHEWDSGWRFTAGFEDEEYMDQPEHHGVYDLNTIANYDPRVIDLLDAPVGSAFEKQEGVGFVAVQDWMQLTEPSDQTEQFNHMR